MVLSVAIYRPLEIPVRLDLPLQIHSRLRNGTFVSPLLEHSYNVVAPHF